ncbi:MAG: polyphosphate kinase 1 [Flavobacteriales bacterium]
MATKKNAGDKFINRELSWLAFNHRVLQEAVSDGVPLIERVRFLGIFSNNLDEFFRIRVAHLRRALLVGKKMTTTLGFDIAETLERVSEKVLELQADYNQAFERCEMELKAAGIHFLDEHELNENQKVFAADFFDSVVRPTLVPVMVGSGVPFPELKDGALYLAVGLKMVDDLGQMRTRFAVIEVPSHLPRFLVLPPSGLGEGVMFIDDVIRLQLGRIFALFQPEQLYAHAIKVTRDAEIDMDDDLSRSLMEKMSRGIARRKKGDYVRFLYDARMPEDMLTYIKKKLKLGKEEEVLIAGSRYHNRRDLMKFPDFGRSDLIYSKQPPRPHPRLRRRTSLLDQVARKDILLHYPYQRFAYIVDILREAAMDPRVDRIHINLYRVASNSQVINALVNAARNGKFVQVVIELAARFDETHNIKVSNVLQEAGAQVEFGVPGLKVHSKLFLISRKSSRQQEYIAHIGTGNFHENTAKVYGDMGLLTSDPGITGEVERLFSFFSNNYERPVFRHLIVSPYSTRRKFSKLIAREMDHAAKGKEAWMILKLNNLVDSEMIEKLYEASCAGVRIQLIIRGICSLIPGVSGMSENIEVKSIVDRYLEHARLLVFSNGGNPEYFISSADWMTRNLDRRIEVSVPIRDPQLKSECAAYLDVQLRDNTKTRIIDAAMANKFVKRKKGEPRIHAQDAMFTFYKNNPE